MSAPSLRSIYQLSEQEVNCIIRDVQDQDAGVRFFFTVDSHEVIDFCFPIHLDEMRAPDVNQIADDQAALYEIFYARTPNPILIPDYEKELRRHLTYLTMRAQEVYDLIEKIDALAGDEVIDDLTSLSRDQILEKMELQFNNLLAVVMGIHFTGVERFQSVIEERLQRIESIQDPHIREAAAAYKQSPLAEEIYDELTRDIEASSLSEPEMYRKLRAAEIDGRAVDWLIHINSHLRKRGKHDYAVLYLSSASRTRRIFALPTVRRVLERQLPRDTLLYRSRAQILARIVSAEPGAEASSTIQNLEQIAKIIAELRATRVEPGSQCDTCVLNDGSPHSCASLNVCTKMKAIEARLEGMQNMGLLARIRRYRQLVVSKPKNAAHREYLESFRKLVETEQLGDLAVARMKAALTLAVAEGQITQAAANPAQTEVRDLPVTAPTYFLPLQPQMADPAHLEIVSQLFAYPELVVRNKTKAHALLQEALRKFEQLDRECGSTNAAHELVRCLIYMTERETARDASRGDANALQYARKMAATNTELRAEFLYVVIWTACRLNQFLDGYAAAQSAVEQFPNDPRSWHGRSINTLFWLEDERQKVFCPLKMSRAISDACRALELYAAQKEDRTAARATLLNNIAWMLSSVDPKSREYDLAAARVAMDQLKQVLASSGWLPRFPGFFHTEAHLLFEEYRRDCKSGCDPAEARAKLKEADEALQQAMKVGDVSYCELLRQQIKREMNVAARRAARR